MKENQDMRNAARKAGIPFWKIADELGISEASMTRKMRRELPDAEKQRVLQIIEQIRKQKQAAGE